MIWRETFNNVIFYECPRTHFFLFRIFSSYSMWTIKWKFLVTNYSCRFYSSSYFYYSLEIQCKQNMLNDKDSLEVSTENDVNWIPILCVNGHHSIVYSIRKLGGFDEKLNSPGYLYLKGVTISWEIVVWLVLFLANPTARYYNQSYIFPGFSALSFGTWQSGFRTNE